MNPRYLHFSVFWKPRVWMSKFPFLYTLLQISTFFSFLEEPCMDVKISILYTLLQKGICCNEISTFNCSWGLVVQLQINKLESNIEK